jgi:hypothetical protein
MKFLDRFDNARKLWEFTLPSVPLPPNDTFIGWLAVYGDSEFESAVIPIPHRIRNFPEKYGAIDSDKVYKLVSSFLKAGRRTQHRSFDGRKAGTCQTQQ